MFSAPHVGYDGAICWYDTENFGHIEILRPSGGFCELERIGGVFFVVDVDEDVEVFLKKMEIVR